MSATAIRKPRANEVRDLVAAQARYDKCKRATEKAKKDRDELLNRIVPKVEIGEWFTAAGWVIRITMQRGGDRFRLSDFLSKHKLTKQMEPFVSEGGESPRLWIKPDA